MKASKYKRMKKGAAYLFIMLFLLLLFAFVSAASAASAGDIFAVNISGSGGGGGQDIAGSINNFYKVALGLGGIAAVAVIVVGALYYTTSGAIDKKNLGKGLITSAIWGLVLLLGAFIVLNTINPELVSLKNPPGIKNPEGEEYEFGEGQLVAGASCFTYPNIPECEPGEKPNMDDEGNLVFEDGKPSCCISEGGACPQEIVEGCTGGASKKVIQGGGSYEICVPAGIPVAWMFLKIADKVMNVAKKSDAIVWEAPYYLMPEEKKEGDQGVLSENLGILGPENASCVPYAYKMSDWEKHYYVEVEDNFKYGEGGKCKHYRDLKAVMCKSY